MRRSTAVVAAAAILVAACGHTSAAVAPAPEGAPTTAVAAALVVDPTSTSAPAAPTTALPTTTRGGPSTTGPPFAPKVTGARPNPTAAASGSLAGRTVAIDPGHNGANGSHPKEIQRQVDAGGFQKDCNTTGTATDAGFTESAFTLAVAQRLATDLRAAGATVVLTRADDAGVGPCVDQRAAIANRATADAFVSIHADGGPPAGRGFHVIRPGPVTGYTDDIVAPSRSLAAALHDALVAGGLQPSTYVGQGGQVERTDLGTLNRSDVPAAMVECANMRNGADAALITGAAGQQRYADALAAGITAFLRSR